MSRRPFPNGFCTFLWLTTASSGCTTAIKIFQGGEGFADFVVLEVISENFILEIFRPPYSLIHFGSICKPTKILFLAALLNLEIFVP